MTWEDAWKEGRIPWDAGAAAPALLEALEGDLPEGRALVPGCGSGYDAFALDAAGYEAVGLDIAPSARARFDEVGASLGSKAILGTEDFFTFETKPFDLIWDYTFLCAIDPAMRPAWRTRMAELLAPEGRLLTLIFPDIDPGPNYEGPPWPLSPASVGTLMEGEFVRESLTRPRASHPGREGKEWLAVWRRA
ncbi:MAG: methyltransferase [Myxococcota bacterium]